MAPADAFLHRLAALAVRVFFRDVEVVGAERMPLRGSVLLVANHVNSLVDPALLLARLPRVPRFLAKSTLWHNPFLRPFLSLARAVPVYRRQDPDVDTGRNVETFAQCREVLARGGALALFPEGISHDEPGIQPLHTGIARIALEAEQRHGPQGLKIVPIGLVFDDKETFRSRALVLVGEPLDPAPDAAAPAPADPEAVRSLTARIEGALRQVTPNYDSWQQARLIERAAALFARPASEDTRRSELAETFPLHRAFREGLDWISAVEADRVSALSAAVARYDRLLTAAGLRDEQVAASYPPSVVIRYLARSLLVLLLWLPLAAVGTLLNWPPYRVIGVIAARAAPSRDTRATYKLFSAVLLFPLVWALEAAAALGLAGGWAALVAALGAPAAGYAALRFHEQRIELAEEARAWLLLRSHRRSVAEIGRRRLELVAEVGALVERYLEARGEMSRGDPGP